MPLTYIHTLSLSPLPLSIHLNLSSLSPNKLWTVIWRTPWGKPSITSLFFNWPWCWGVSWSLWTSSRWSFSSPRASLCHQRRRTLKKTFPSLSKSDSSSDMYPGSITLRSLSLLMPWRASLLSYNLGTWICYYMYNQGYSNTLTPKYKCLLLALCWAVCCSQHAPYLFPVPSLCISQGHKICIEST